MRTGTSEEINSNCYSINEVALTTSRNVTITLTASKDYIKSKDDMNHAKPVKLITAPSQ